MTALEDRDDDYSLVGSFELERRQGLQRFAFPPREARYVRLRLLSLHRAGKPGLGEVAVLGPAPPDAVASAEGETAGDREDGTGAAAGTADDRPPDPPSPADRDDDGDAGNGPGPRPVTPPQPADDAARPTTDHAVFRAAGVVLEARLALTADAGPPAASAPALDEHSGPLYLHLQNRGDGGHGIQASLQARAVGGYPADGAFGTTRGYVGKGKAKVLKIAPPLPAGWLAGDYRVRLEDSVSRQFIGELEFVVAPGFARPRLLADGERIAGYNIAAAELGGRITAFSSQRNDNSRAVRHLNDGLVAACDGCGWISRNADPQSLTFGFHEDRAASVHGIVFDTRYTVTAMNTLRADAYVDQVPLDAEVWRSEGCGGGAFVLVGRVRLHRTLARQHYAFPPVPACRVRIALPANYGGNRVRLGEIAILEAPGAATIVHDRPVNLASPANGGALVYATPAQGLDAAGRLIDGDRTGRAWRGAPRKTAHHILLAFRDDRPALIERVVIHLPDGKPEFWPHRIDLAVAEGQIFGGYRELGSISVSGTETMLELPVSATAQYLMLTLPASDDRLQTWVSEIEVIEGRAPGYVSLLARASTTPAPQSAATAEAEARAPVDEHEPNDAPADAGMLVPGAPVTGTIAPLGERDLYRLAPEFAAGRALTADVSVSSSVRVALKLLDAQGRVTTGQSVGLRTADRERLTWVLSGAEAFLSVGAPGNAVVLLWDTSGSMERHVGDLERAVHAYVDALPEIQKLQLIRFGEDVDILLDGFTSDKRVLKASLGGQFEPQRGTRLFDAIARGIDLLAEMPGNRALVVTTDGIETGSALRHLKFWEVLRTSGVRHYPIGLGHQMLSYAPELGKTNRRQLSHMATATGGRALFAIDSSEVHAFFEQIAAELNATPHYRILPSLDGGPGELVLRTTQATVEAPFQETAGIAFVLDASGSMVERDHLVDGRLKMEVAKQALRDSLRSLPAHSNVALRVYGRRIREGAPGDCEDSELLYPMAPLDLAKLEALIDGVRALGTTPLAYAMKHAAADLDGIAGEKIIVMITDGKEECGGDLAAVVADLQRRGIDVRLNILGFGLEDESLKHELAAVAGSTAGIFVDTQDATALTAAIGQATGASFQVRDAAGRAVARGHLDGGPAVLPEGVYRVTSEATVPPLRIPGVEVTPSALTTIEIGRALGSFGWSYEIR